MFTISAISPESAQKLARAYADLLTRGERPTVRRLQSEARVGTDAATEYLREIAAAGDAPPVPVEDAARAVEVLWARLWPLAQEAAREEHAAQVDALVEAEVEALRRAEAAEADAARARAELVEAERRIAAAEAMSETLRLVVEALRDRATPEVEG